MRKLAEEDPAFASLALWVRHRDGDAGLAFAKSTSTTITYGASFETLSLAEQVGVAAHHILHVAFRHAPRSAAMAERLGGAHDRDLFNLAADALVNAMLDGAGYVQPRPRPELAELLSRIGTVEGGLSDWDVERLYFALRGAEGDGQGKTHSTAEGSRGFRPDLETDSAGGGTEDADWRQRVARAMEAGRAAGRGIGLIAGRIGDVPEARTPWEAVLRGALAKAVSFDPRRSSARPARSWIARDSLARQAGGPTPAFEAGFARDGRIPRIAVGIDVSTSIDPGLRAMFAAQVAGVGKRTGAEVHVLVFDEVVQSHRKMQGLNWEREIADLPLAQGGGTSFVDVVERARALDPSAIVVLTDLDGPFGEAPGRVPVIWATPKANAPEPPFGRVLSLAR